MRLLCLRRSLLSPPRTRLVQTMAHLSNGGNNDSASSTIGAVSLKDLPKTNNFTSNLPADSAYRSPLHSHVAPREDLGPRAVKHALYTYVRPEKQKDHELLGVSPAAMKDIGIREGEEKTGEFQEVVSGNLILGYDEKTGEGIYPWAQCYGGWQFGQWAGQLGDGRAISLFESTNPATFVRYEIQLKGAGQTPYSRFADGKAVLRSSIREFIVSEALHALHIPTTRALALTLLPSIKVRRERLEPGAIVARFSPSWLRIGTFDLLRSRGDRVLIRKLATYVATHVFTGWESLPTKLTPDSDVSEPPPSGIGSGVTEGAEGEEENRFARLYREIVRRNAKTVARWQAYGFMNGVLNTDNTSIMGLSIDFGPFAFMDNFDPSYTPNHDDSMLRYSYKNQPTIIWWNLTRLGEDLGELLGTGAGVDEEEFIEKGVKAEDEEALIKRAEGIIERAGEEYKGVFLAEYKDLMTKRLGLKTQKESDFKELFSELLDLMEELELDFNHFFRRLSALHVATGLETEEQRKKHARLFFHREVVTAPSATTEKARERVAAWLVQWRARLIEDWGTDAVDGTARTDAMKAVNPKFIPRSWVLDELIKRVEHGGEREILERVMNMALHPFEESWGGDRDEEERFCGDVPRLARGMQCSCSS